MRWCYSLVMFMALLMLVSGAGLMAGCGKKGALYRPIEAQVPTDKDKAKAAKPKPTQQP